MISARTEPWPSLFQLSTKSLDQFKILQYKWYYFDIAEGAILKFFTGENEEPLLRFHVAPNMVFVPVKDDATMMLTSSTCMKTLYLPTPMSVEREKQLKTKDYYEQLDVSFFTDRQSRLEKALLALKMNGCEIQQNYNDSTLKTDDL